MRLTGITQDAFTYPSDGTLRNAFVTATAASAGVAPSSVDIVGVSTVQTRRRSMLQATALQVDFRLMLLSAAAASSASTRIITSGGPSLAALQSAGLPVTGVALASPPVVNVAAAPPLPPMPPPPASPPPSPPPPAGCGASWFCYAGVACTSASTCGACPFGLAGDGRTCAACTLRVSLTRSFAADTLVRSADATFAAVVSSAEASCNASLGYTFAWTTNGTTSSTGAPLQLTNAKLPSLLVPARSFSSGQTAAVTVTACVTGAASTSCVTGTATFAVTPSPLVALLGGGGGVVGETPLTLSGTASYDPDGAPQSSLAFAWSCVRTDEGRPSDACAARDGTANALGTSATQLLQLQGASAGAAYFVTLNVSLGARSSVTNTTLTVMPGALPVVSIAGSAVLSGIKANPSQQLVLFANASSFVPGPVTTRWSVAAQSAPGPLLNLSDPAVCATPLTSASMVLRPGVLAAGARYTLVLRATDAAGAVGLANATVATSAPPYGGWASVTPTSGVALSTPFNLTAAGWLSDELPLSYTADYFTEGSSAATMSLTGGVFQESPSFGVQLPAGLPSAGNVITLQLTVRSAFGATTAFNVSVSVTWPVFASTTEVSTFVDNAAARAASALQSGDSSAALQVVSGLAALLNSDVSASVSSNASSNGADADAAAAAQRASLLNIVAGAVSQSASLATAPAAIESTAALVSQLVSTPTQLSADGASTALQVLGALAGAGAAVSPAAAQSVAAALSSVATSSSASPTSNASASTSLGSQVLGVLDSLAGSQSNGMSVPGQSPATVTTDAIQMSVSLDAPGSSRLFNSTLSAPGSSSAFDPLPADALAAAGAAPISTVFLSLSFDAHGKGTAGVTRLAFSAADTGDALPVSNLSAPILFTIPSASLDDGQVAQCSWWDEEAQAYSTAGCASLPSPSPPGHNLSFVPGFLAHGPASLTTAWAIEGDLLSGCTLAFLDCTNATQRMSKLQLDPASPLTAPLVGCGNATDVVLRAYIGTRCQLRNSSNAAGCAWDARNQSFGGPGCVAANMTRCMCTHLKDFSSGSRVSIPVCSLDDLVGLNSADIITKLKLLFIVVISLFAGMNIGSALTFGIDVRERRRIGERLRTPECGFRVTDDGVYLWRFALEPLPDELAPPRGPAVEMSQVMGVPWSRMRAALPDDLLTTDYSAALGRRHGFSLTGMTASKDTQRAMLMRRRGKLVAAPPSDKLTAIVSDKVDEVAATADNSTIPHDSFEKCTTDAAALEEFVGTALVLAFYQAGSLMPVVELTERRVAAAAYFDAMGLRTPAGQTFLEVSTSFVSLMMPGVLNTRSKWLVKARLWRLILSQSSHGFWDASSTTAFAVLARSLSELANLQSNWLERLKDRIDNFSEGFENVVDERAGASGGEQDLGQLQLQGSVLGARGSMRIGSRFSQTSAAGTPRTSSTAAAHAAVENDDPLLFHSDAIAECMPRRLLDLQRSDPQINVQRVWTTMCCITTMEMFNVCWLATDGDLYPAIERTIVDHAREWLEAYAVEHPALASALSDGKLAASAARTVVQWSRAWQHRVATLRRSQTVTEFRLLSHVHRASCDLIRAACTKHETFSVFLSTPLDGLQRWQKWAILMTLVINALMVNIWMFYAKGVNCCAELRSLLDADQPGSCPGVGECRGFAGNCGDLAAAFAGMPVLPDYPNGLGDWSCHAFPDDDSPRDSLIVGLIALAIAWPVSFFLANMFEVANDNEAPESWLIWAGVQRLLWGRAAHRRWHYTRGKQPVRFVRWYIRCINAPKSETMINLWHSLVAFVTCSKPPWILEAEEKEAEAQREAERLGQRVQARAIDDEELVPSAVRLRAKKRRLAVLGVLSVYFVWAVFTWFIFTYGMLIYKLMGDGTQQSFARSWGVSYGVGAAAEWKGIAREALVTVLFLVVLETLHLTRSVTWIEEHADYLSLQTLLMRHTQLSLLQQTRLLYAFQSRLSD